MTCFQLGLLILGIIVVGENGQRSFVSGVPVDKFDGSRLCGFDFGSIGAEAERYRIAFEVVYGDISSVLANSIINCNMEYWRDAARLSVPPGNKRSLDQREVQLTRENDKLFKVYEQMIKCIIQIHCYFFVRFESIPKIAFND